MILQFISRLRGLIPADDAQLTQNGYEDCTFNKFATWAGRIKNKFMWEAGMYTIFFTYFS